MYQRYQVWIGLVLLFLAFVDAKPLRGQARSAPRLHRVAKKYDDDEVPPPPPPEEDDDEYTDDDEQQYKEAQGNPPSASSPPAFSPTALEGDGSGTNQNTDWQIQNACRAASRDTFIESPVSIKVTYSYQIQTTSEKLSDQNIVDQALKDYLQQAYILAYCKDSNRRNLASSSFQPGDVWSIKQGSSEIVTDSSCEPSQQDAFCFPLEGTVVLSMNSQYQDESGASALVQSDIANAFNSGQVLTTAKENDKSILSLEYGSAVDGGSSNGDANNNRSVEHTGGMKTGGKVSLALFMVCLFAVVGYVGYKKYKGDEIFKSSKRQQSQARGPSYGSYFSPFTDRMKKLHSNISQKLEIPRPNRSSRPLSSRRGGRRSQNRQVEDQDDPDIVIADTTDTHSTAEGAGTELILADLQDTSQSSPVEFVIPNRTHQKSKPQNKFTPETLPSDDEYSKPHDISWDYSLGQVSFGGDVQVMVDDASSYASSVNLFRPKARPYKTPDTLDL